jgi:alcohol dehydrogenase
VKPQTFHPAVQTLLCSGAGAIDQLHEAVAPLGRRVMLVTDAGIAAAGHVDRALRSLAAAGLHVDVFSDVQENPTTDHVNACLAASLHIRPNVLVALGGGSVIDTAKGCNFLHSFGGQMRDYWGWNKAPAGTPMLPLVALPTTAGTGSEAQSYALISDAQTHQKMACGDERARPHTAVLDPTLTLSLPPRVTAVTGIDAIAHAVESAVARNRNDLSIPFSFQAFELLGSLTQVWREPANLEHRRRMLLGAFVAGLAIENSMLGIAHSLANPLTANLGLAHGAAVGMMLPHVVRFNRQDAAVDAIYQRLFPGDLADHLDRLLATLELPTRLAPRPSDEQLTQLAQQAATQWTARFNPRPVTPDDLLRLYQQVC